MAVERLADGFDLGLAGDHWQALCAACCRAVSSGGLLLLAGGIFLYTFFAGGLFCFVCHCLGKPEG
ncbi:MAG: hypothetical protein MZV63_45605 [Marinilabiliales bacterium]|nr:hypothetical protein [Marinilabiliales bacterium]